MALFNIGWPNLVWDYNFTCEDSVRGLLVTTPNCSLKVIQVRAYISATVVNTFIFGIYDDALNLVKNSQAEPYAHDTTPNGQIAYYTYVGMKHPILKPKKTYYLSIQASTTAGIAVVTGDNIVGNAVGRYDSVYTGTLPANIPAWTSTASGLVLNVLAYCKMIGHAGNISLRGNRTSPSLGLGLGLE